MMTSLFVSPHKTAHEWARRYFPCTTYRLSVNRRILQRLPTSVEIYGQLAVPLAAVACEAGLKYFHLNIPGITSAMEITPESIQAMNPRFTLYRIEEMDSILASELRGTRSPSGYVVLHQSQP